MGKTENGKPGPLERFMLMQSDGGQPRVDIRDLSGTRRRFEEHYRKYELLGWLKALSLAVMVAIATLAAVLWSLDPPR